jgi:hypothetical protein
MCLASKYLNQLDNVVKGIESDHNKLFSKLSEYDSLISELYHKVEVSNFNACEGYYYSKQLQELLRKRRVIKDEISRLNTLKQTLNLKSALPKSKINNSKQCIDRAINKSCKWQQNWKYTYTLEEVLN